MTSIKMTEAINLLQKKILASHKYDPQYIEQGRIRKLNDYLMDVISDNIFSEIFNTETVNKLEYGTYTLGYNNLFLFLTKLHEFDIKFSYNQFMMKLLYYKTGASNQLSTYNKIFDYLYDMNEFDSYEFVYNNHTSHHILETIKINYQIDYIRLINECLKSSCKETIIRYLLKYVDNINDISIDHIMKHGENMIMINEFISSGLNIEILHCKYDYHTICKLIHYINIDYIHLIKQINISRGTYARFLCKTSAKKLDELLSRGCSIIFIEDEIDTDPDTYADEVARINDKNIEIDNKLRVLEAHNIDLQFIVQHYVLDTDMN